MISLGICLDACLPGQYGEATISRLLKSNVSFAKEPYKRDDILQIRMEK